MASTPNMLLNAFLPAPLEVVWMTNGSSLLVLTDNNQRCNVLHKSLNICDHDFQV